MSYRKVEKPQYLTDRRSWNMAFQKVLARRRSLESEGWTVERGSLTKAQADRAVKELDSLGYETERLPLGVSNGETVEFVAYKPKPQVSTLKAKPKAEPELEGGNPLQRFYSLLEAEGKKAGVEDLGLLSSYIPSGQYTMAVIMHNANPLKPGGISIDEVADEIIANPEKTSLINYAELDKLEKGGIRYVSFAGVPFSVAGLKNALKVLGVQQLPKAYAVYAKSNIAVLNPDIDYVVMTPVAADSWEDRAVSEDYLEGKVLKLQPKT